MSSITLSVILYAAIHSGQHCETVFQAAAHAANPGTILQEEQPYLKELAGAACQTNNPDIIWQIVQKETNFRFVIVRRNIDNKGIILRGKEALAFLKTLSRGESDRNVDIGAMQLNWGWHRQEFAHNAERMMSPAEQVNYLLEHFGDSIYRRCSERWVGCYHNPSNTASAERYEKSVYKKGHVLGLATINYLSKTRQAMSAEEKAELPHIDQDELMQVLQKSRDLPLPAKNIFSYSNSLQMQPIKVVARNSRLNS